MRGEIKGNQIMVSITKETIHGRRGPTIWESVKLITAHLIATVKTIC